MKPMVVLVLTVGMLVTPPAGRATGMLQMSLEELSTTASKIVQVKVTAVVPKWNPDSTIIFAASRVLVDDHNIVHFSLPA